MDQVSNNTKLKEAIDHGFDIEHIVWEAIRDIQREAASDYDGAGSLSRWAKFSNVWFDLYHEKIARRAQEIATDKRAKQALDKPSTNRRHI